MLSDDKVLCSLIAYMDGALSCLAKIDGFYSGKTAGCFFVSGHANALVERLIGIYSEEYEFRVVGDVGFKKYLPDFVEEEFDSFFLKKPFGVLACESVKDDRYYIISGLVDLMHVQIVDCLGVKDSDIVFFDVIQILKEYKKKWHTRFFAVSFDYGCMVFEFRVLIDDD